MPRVCPFCAEAIGESARTCAKCGSALTKTCPFCAEDMSSLAKICPHCRSDLASPSGEGPASLHALGKAAERKVGEERGVLVTLLVGFFTLGFYAIYVFYQQAQEIRAHQGGKRLNPQLDLALCLGSWLLTLGTAPFWVYYVMYRYPKAYVETCIAEEIPCRDVLTPCFLIAIMSASLLAAVPLLFCVATCLPIWVVSVALLQHELNAHWSVHRQLG